MTQDERDYIEDLQMTFATPGWRRMVDEAHKQIYQFQCDVLERTKTIEEVFYLRGRAEQLVLLINLPDTIRVAILNDERAKEEDAGEELAFIESDD